MRRNVLETALAAMVLLVAGVFLAFAHNIGNVAPVDGWQVQAKFNSIDGLSIGNDVRIGGVKVGTVVKLDIDQKDYRALVTMMVLPELKLPEDTVASVVTAGVLGGKYIALAPGTGKRSSQHGLVLKNTKDVEPVETTVGKEIFGLGGGAGL
ncbi:MAG: outer membrane lipid asymmetry maintenance protein MlaD [Rhodospirillaceae bacterium]|nr:outer membrane lipid asymmetry maintenance protein MlaD [Rhodospirillaceae bacterium]HAA91997.1 outer membrane lipid asymmetry maintenance protein MlaD [Rhodospirillaceae bacterium]